MNEQKFRLRISYSKTGRLKYLSHLETMRCLERSIRRANLPYLVSQGFSPHMKVSFGWALPVGVSSQCEYIDVLIGEYIEPEEICGVLASSLPTNMQVKDAYYVDPSACSLEEAFPYSVYTCKFALDCDHKGESGDPKNESGDQNPASAGVFDRTKKALDKLLARGNMVVHRKKKDKVVEFEGLLVATPELTLTKSGSGSCNSNNYTQELVEMQIITFTEGKGSLRPDLFCAELVSFDDSLKVHSIERVLQSLENPCKPDHHPSQIPNA